MTSCRWWSALTLLVLVNLSTTQGAELHQHMSVEDLQRVFHVDSHDQVPEYEVVAVRAINKRSSGSEGSGHSLVAHLEAFGRPLELALQRTTTLSRAGPPSALRMWVADSGNSEVHLTEIPQAEHDVDIGHTYQDEQSGAALLVHRDPQDGTLIVEGTIGSDLVVRPLPASVRHLAPTPSPSTDESEDETEDDSEVDPNDDEMFLDEEPGQEEAVSAGFPLKPEKSSKKKATQVDVKKSRASKSRSKRSAASVGMHVVIKRNSPDVADPLSDYAFMEPDHLSKRFRERRSVKKSRRRRGREAPYVIYPEILVIVDYDGYRLHGGDNVQIKRYFVSFWNGVDLRYKLLKGPKVRISIAGIIISRGRDATPYLERNRVGRDAIDSAAALTDMGKYLFRERRLPVYDIAVAITKLDMCRRQYANDACNRGTAGFAYVGGACVVNKRLEKVNSVAIIEDTGGFSGIIVAAHEVGHLLGAVHDGSPPPSYLGGPGAEKCRWEDGFIMSDLRHTEKGFRWSACSVSSFHHFLNGETATCLFNAPHEDDALPRVLPGKLLTLDAQCRKDRGTSACFKDDRVCAQLFCFDANSGYCVAYRPAAEGSPCGDGQSCLNGRCVAEHENIIPDYTQITPSYARPENQPAATQARPVYAEPPARNVTSSTRSPPPWGNLWASTTPLNPSSSTKSKAPNYYSNTKSVAATKSTSYYKNTPSTNYYNPYKSTTYQSTTSTYYNPYSTKSNPYSYSSTSNPYTYSSTAKPYSTANPYSYSSTPNPYAYSSTANPYAYSSTSNPYSYSSTPSPFSYSTTSNPYSYSSTSNPYSYSSTSNPYSYSSTSDPYSYQSSTANPYSYSTTTNNPYSYSSTSTSSYSKQNPYSQDVGAAVVGGDNGDTCEDRPSKSPSSMSCTDLLSRYPLQYCGSYYIKKNCCASMRSMCPAHMLQQNNF